MFSFLDIWFIKKELNQLLNFRFEKFFQGENFLLLQFSKEKKMFLKFVFGQALFLADKEKNAEFFTERNEKLKTIFSRIERFILKEIKVYPGERIVDLIFEGFNTKKTLRFSIFGKGEIELFENDNYYSYLGFGSEIKKNINLENLKEEIKNNSSLTIRKFLNNYLGFGKYYVEEFKERYKVDLNLQLGELTDNYIDFLSSKIKEFLNLPLSPFMSEKRPFPIEMVTQKVLKRYESFSEALDDFFRPKSKYERVIEETLKAIEKQKEKIKELEKEKDLYEEMGNLIYNYYSFFEELKKYQNKEDFWDKVKGLGFKVDLKNKCIKMEFDKLKELLKKLYGY